MHTPQVPLSLLSKIQQCENNIADMQREYDEKLKNRKHALAVQYRLLNLLQPIIARLPDDLLVIIFEAYYEATKHSHSSSCYDIDPFCVIHLTHICHRWRNLVHDSPTVWNEVDLAWPEWRVNYLPYSRTMPLAVRLIDHQPRGLVDHITSSRFAQPIGRITIDQRFDDNAAFLTKIPVSSLSQLRSLDLTLCALNTEMCSFLAQLPDSIRTLKVQMFHSIQKPLSFFIPMLRSLKLDFCPLKMPMEDCIQGLSQMHHLEELALYNVFDESKQVTSRVMLNTLKKLDLTQEIGSCTIFLHHVHFTTLTSIRLEVDGCQSIDQHKRFRAVTGRIIRCNQVLSTAIAVYDYPFRILNWLIASHTHDLLDTCLDIQVTWKDRVPSDPSIFPVIPLDLSRLTYLKATVSWFDPSTLWWYRIGNSLTTLWLDGLNPLTRPTIWRPLSGMGRVFPYLKKLIIREDKHAQLLQEYCGLITTMFEELCPPQPSLEISLLLPCSTLPQHTFHAMMQGVLLSYKRSLGRRMDGGSVPNLWYHYSLKESPLGRIVKEANHLVTDFDPQSGLDCCPFLPENNEMNIKFWLEEVSHQPLIA